jgi:hypothetical protein
LSHTASQFIECKQYTTDGAIPLIHPLSLSFKDKSFRLALVLKGFQYNKIVGNKNNSTHPRYQLHQ